MPLTGIYGSVGSGKNIIDVIDAYCTPKEIPIYSNYKINLKNVEVIEPEEVFEVFVQDDKVPIKKLKTDEAYSWFENRGSGNTDLNKFLSYLMFQARKRGLNWNSIAQLRGTLDLRWRGMEDKIIACHKRVLDNAGNSNNDFKYTIVDGFRIKTICLPYAKSKRFFDLYDTKKVIVPQEFNDITLRIKNKNPDNLNKYIDSLALLIKKKFTIPVKTLKNGEIKEVITQDWVRDKLLRLKKDFGYASFVKVRLKDEINN